jgi:hypothetical protein
MNSSPKAVFRYEPRRCEFFRKHVWAIRTRQANGTWRIVNCLDKEHACSGVDCCFAAATGGGAWPYPA